MRIMVEIDVSVRNFVGETDPLPTLDQIVAAWRKHTDDELLSYKELAESQGLTAAVEMTIVDVALAPADPPDDPGEDEV